MDLNFRTLRADEIECRVQSCKATGVSLLLYKDARCDMNILDETVGPMRWKREHSRDNANCTVSIWDDEHDHWVGKEDTGTESNTEKEKGLASDSFKRSCFNWGIGRELYTAPFIWIPASECQVKPQSNGKYQCYDRFSVRSIIYDEGRRISTLVIFNDTRKTKAFTMGAATHAQDQPRPARQTIGPDKVNALLARCKESGVDSNMICVLYKVANFSDLSEVQHKHIIDNWEGLRLKGSA